MPLRSKLRRLPALALTIALVGCNTLQGARLYRDGTRALDEGDPDAAILSLEAAARHVPEASEVHNHLGLAYLAAGREDAALHAFERAVMLDCENAAAAQNLRRLRGNPQRR